jgi:hypothetical protein
MKFCKGGGQRLNDFGIALECNALVRVKKPAFNVIVLGVVQQSEREAAKQFPVGCRL